MDAYQSRLNGNVKQKKSTKRQRETKKSSQRKIQRVDAQDESEKPTKIIDLNDDCLRKIFGYLDLKHLLNVAIACEWLRPAAVDAYKRKFRKKEVVINDCNDFRPNVCGDAYEIGPPQVRNTNISIYGLKTCLLYLRCFGTSINHLTIDYYKSDSKRYAFVHRYIDRYCTESLDCISFVRLPGTSIEFEKPFTNVRNVIVRDCDLGNQLTSCGKWIPKLRRLKLTNVRLTDNFDQTTFRHLKYLCICLDDRVGSKTTDAAQLLQSNHRLRRFEMEAYKQTISMHTLLDLIKDQSALTKLDMRMLCQRDDLQAKLPEVQQLIDEHPSLAHLRLPHYKFKVDGVCALIDQLTTLKSFHFRMKNSSNYTLLESMLDESKWILTKVYDWDSDYVKLNRNDQYFKKEKHDFTFRNNVE